MLHLGYISNILLPYFVFGRLHYDNFDGVASADCRRKDFDVNFGRAASDACSAAWNLGPNFAFILVLKESCIHLNYITSNFLPQRKQSL